MRKRKGKIYGIREDVLDVGGGVVRREGKIQSKERHKGSTGSREVMGKCPSDFVLSD